MKFLILFFFVIVCILLVLQFCSAAHYIIGAVNDAEDGTSADDRTIVFSIPLKPG